MLLISIGSRLQALTNTKQSIKNYSYIHSLSQFQMFVQFWVLCIKQLFRIGKCFILVTPLKLKLKGCNSVTIFLFGLLLLILVQCFWLCWSLSQWVEGRNTQTHHSLTHAILLAI